jgi:hypothetical protein
VDQIIPWGSVREGDLVLLDDALTVAEQVHAYQDIWNRETGETFTRVDISHRLDNGVLVSSERHGDCYTAVRRYVEG